MVGERVVLGMSRRRARETCRVPGCTRPVDGVTVCADDMAEHDDRLDHLAVIAAALEDRFLKAQQFSVAGLGNRRPDESPLPFDQAASRVRRQLLRALVRWGHAFDEVDPFGYPARLGYARVPPSVTHLVEHLRRHREFIAVSVLGAQAVDDIRQAYNHALRVVDRPPDLVYLGICSMDIQVDGQPAECDADLYAEWGNDHARCRKCKHQHDVKNRQAVLRVAVKDQLATASDIARGLSGMDIAVTAERIRQWKHRGRLVPHGSTLKDDPLYLVGDVIDLVLGERERLRAELRKPTTRKAEPA